MSEAEKKKEEEMNKKKQLEIEIPKNAGEQIKTGVSPSLMVENIDDKKPTSLF